LLGVGDLTELRGAACTKQDNHKNKNKNKNLIFIFIFGWTHATSRSSVGPPVPSRTTNKNKNIFIFILFSFAPWDLALRTSTGLSHGSPPFDFEVAFCPTPLS
jgi:hypothetical protein